MAFGLHVDRVHSTHGGRPGIVAHIQAARRAALAAGFDARAFQVFVAGPRNLTVTLHEDEADELRAFVDASAAAPGGAVRVYAHGTYMDTPWKGNPYIAKFIRTELALCTRAGIAGLVIHLGVPPIAEVMEALPRLVAATDALLYLEVPHVLPRNSHYETPEKLADLFRAVRTLDPQLSKFALCIDTAHLWSCGVDLQSFEAAEDWLQRLEAVAGVIPPERVLLHLNDSLDARGSGVDHHAPLLQGRIWGDYASQPQQSGLAAFVDYAVRHGTPTILERGSGGTGAPPPALLDDYAVLGRLTTAVRVYSDVPSGTPGV